MELGTGLPGAGEGRSDRSSSSSCPTIAPGPHLGAGPGTARPRLRLQGALRIPHTTGRASSAAAPLRAACGKAEPSKALAKNEEVSEPTPRPWLSAGPRSHRGELLPETLRAALNDRGPSRTQAGCNTGGQLSGSNALPVAEQSHAEHSSKTSTKPFWTRSGELARTCWRCSLKQLPLLCSRACLRYTSCDTSGCSTILGKKGSCA